MGKLLEKICDFISEKYKKFILVLLSIFGGKMGSVIDAVYTFCNSSVKRIEALSNQIDTFLETGTKIDVGWIISEVNKMEDDENLNIIIPDTLHDKIEKLVKILESIKAIEEEIKKSTDEKYSLFLNKQLETLKDDKSDLKYSLAFNIIRNALTENKVDWTKQAINIAIEIAVGRFFPKA